MEGREKETGARKRGRGDGGRDRETEGGRNGGRASRKGRSASDDVLCRVFVECDSPLETIAVKQHWRELPCGRWHEVCVCVCAQQ